VFCGKRAFRSLVGAVAVRVLAGTIPFREWCKAAAQRVGGGTAAGEACLAITLPTSGIWECVMPEKFAATVSTKGEVILPKAIRRVLRWEGGTRRIVENRSEGVLLKPEPGFWRDPAGRGIGMPGLGRRPKVFAGHAGGRSGRGQAAPCGRLIPTSSYDT